MTPGARPVDAAAGAWLNLIYTGDGIGNIDNANVPGMKRLLQRHTDLGEGEHLVVLAFDVHIGVEVAADANFSTGINVGLDCGAGVAEPLRLRHRGRAHHARGNGRLLRHRCEPRHTRWRSGRPPHCEHTSID